MSFRQDKRELTPRKYRRRRRRQLGISEVCLHCRQQQHKHSSKLANSMIKMQSKWKSPVGKLDPPVVCIIIIVIIASLLQQQQHCKAVVLDESPPRITIQPNDLVAIEGESAELNCDAEGLPEPSIEWYHNGHLIKASTYSRTTMGGSIQFLDIRAPSASSSIGLASQQQQLGAGSDAGVYYCLARNSLGQAQSRNASLQVACK